MIKNRPSGLKFILAFAFLFVNNICLNAQEANYGKIDSLHLPVLYSHYQKEIDQDACIDPGKWDKVKSGLNLSVISTDAVFFRKEVPVLNDALLKIEKTAWRGERVNFELLLWSADTVNQINIEVDDLTGSSNNTISKENSHVYLIRYVVSNFSFNSSESTCGEGPINAGYLLPDRFEDFKRFQLPGRTVRPIWISINVPDNAFSENYRGNIHITTEKQSFEIPVELEVQNQTLPEPGQWKFRLDLWQNPWVISDYYNIKPWSEEFKLLLRKHLKLYADAGGKYITTYAVHSPWSDNSYYVEKSMIEWIKQKNGSWRFDYTDFDQYVLLAQETGITKAITVYTLIPWGDRFIYFDEQTKNYITENWSVTSDVYKKNINEFLNSLKEHLIEKGWFNKTFLGINENELDQTLRVIDIIKQNSKDWKITYAGYWHSELNDLLDDYSCQLKFEPSAEELKTRSLSNKFTTTYVCCVPAKPNNYLYSPPIEGRWISWYIDARGYDGFLRWALDGWPSDPERDARHNLWPAGDSFLIYPGANSCIRFEKIREGIVDFEKIKIIELKIRNSNDKIIKTLWEDFETNRKKILQETGYEKTELEAMIETGNQIISKLSRKLK